jgi:hypothetical protein
MEMKIYSFNTCTAREIEAELKRILLSNKQYLRNRDKADIKSALREIWNFKKVNKIIDLPEIFYLWDFYLKTGKLDFYEVLWMAKERHGEDVRETERELHNWLHSGI